SERRAGRHVVAAIIGGRSGRARDAQKEGLIGKYTLQASTKQTAPAIAENAHAAAPRLAAAESVPVPSVRPEREAKPEVIDEPKAPAPRLADSRPVETDAARALRATAYAPEVGSKEPIRPVAVKTLAVKGSTMQTASLMPVTTGNTRITTVKTATSSPDPRFEKPIDLKTHNQAVALASADTSANNDALPPAPPGAKPGVLGVLPVQVASADPTDAVAVAAHAKADAKSRSGWFIQVGALESEKEAKERLSEVRSATKALLKHAEAYTETVKKGARTFYRARFAGFDEAGAAKACREIKASKFVCMPARN
ncbi:MAG: SPOR domain-containing protein, partial [Pseudolabrys sp.]